VQYLEKYLNTVAEVFVTTLPIHPNHCDRSFLSHVGILCFTSSVHQSAQCQYVPIETDI